MGKVAYHLNLPASLQIYTVFHVSLLHDHKHRVGEKFPEPQTLRLAVGPEVRKYKVEAILATRIQTNPSNPPLLQYKIAWMRYTKLTWEPAANLRQARRLIQSFHKNNPEMPRDVRS